MQALKTELETSGNVLKIINLMAEVNFELFKKYGVEWRAHETYAQTAQRIKVFAPEYAELFELAENKWNAIEALKEEDYAHEHD